jgi:hypothetical protein
MPPFLLINSPTSISNDILPSVRKLRSEIKRCCTQSVDVYVTSCVSTLVCIARLEENSDSVSQWLSSRLWENK